MPGQSARPDPSGEPFPVPERWTPREWRSLLPYLYGIDLYNRAYWWECHEVLEGLWHAAGRTTPPARFVQGIIHLAAAQLNWNRGHTAAARRQARRGIERMAVQAGEVYMGIDVDRLITGIQAWVADGRWEAEPIVLAMGDE